MATLSSHTLNGTDGTHAGGITVRLIETASNKLLFSSETDSGGRLRQEIAPEEIDPSAQYDLIFETKAYWQPRGLPREGKQILDSIVIRLSMPEPEGQYHIPLILSPNSYSVWWSA